MMWQEKILVVSDDNAANVELKSVLEREGLVEVADSVEHALNDLDYDYCAVIVVNADSAGIDIADFLGRAESLYPNIRKRFLFVTAAGHSSKYGAFLEKNGLKCIKEPTELRDETARILSMR